MFAYRPATNTTFHSSLGASFGGLSCAHAFLDDVLPRLHISSHAPAYRLVIISPSTHIYWNIGAPRALVAPELIPTNDLFIPIEPGFHRHRGHNFSIIQGEAISWDTAAHTLEIELIGRAAEKRMSQISKRFSRELESPLTLGARTQTMTYHALILATGSSARSELLSLHGPHLNTIGALTSFHARVAAAKSVIISGGGASGVETAGQLATYLNNANTGRLSRRPKDPKTLILITSDLRLLPALAPKFGRKAHRMLEKLGVDIRYNLGVSAAREDFDLTGQTKIELEDDTSLIVDAYVDCTGVTPNSSYAPAELRDQGGYIRTNGSTLRVEAAGPRVFALGDVASYSCNYVRDVYAAVPVVMQNLGNDLLAHEYRLASPYGGSREKVEALADEVYVQKKMDSLLMPISRFGGVGALGGFTVPSLMVHILKGRDYRTGKAKAVVVDGGNPYSVKPGTKYE